MFGGMFGGTVSNRRASAALADRLDQPERRDGGPVSGGLFIAW